jgi:hypothetical protein
LFKYFWCGGLLDFTKPDGGFFITPAGEETYLDCRFAVCHRDHCYSCGHAVAALASAKEKARRTSCLNNMNLLK